MTRLEYGRRKGRESFSKRYPARAWQVFVRDGGKCFWCKDPLAVGEITFDHVQMRLKGGSDSITNIVLSCKNCNFRRNS